MNRWQCLPQTVEGAGGNPWAKGELVKFADLRRVLPEGTKSVTWKTEELTTICAATAVIELPVTPRVNTKVSPA